MGKVVLLFVEMWCKIELIGEGLGHKGGRSDFYYHEEVGKARWADDGRNA